MRVVFAGTPAFAAVHLAALIDSGHELVGVLTQPDRPAGRGKRLQASPVKTRALDAGVPVLQPASLRSADARESLAALAADVMVVVAYGVILPAAVLDIPAQGCLNVHASLLPRWRGAAPIQRAIAAGDRETGVTIMQMDAGLDTGDMLAASTCAIDDTTTAASLHNRLADIGAPLLISVLDELTAARQRAIPQDKAAATHAAKINKQEADVDWSMTAIEIDRRVRAFNPSPTAYSCLGGERVKVWRTRAEDAPHSDEPGTLLDPVAGAPRVACGRGALILEELQFPGGRVLPARELMKSRAALLAPGQRFTRSTD